MKIDSYEYFQHIYQDPPVIVTETYKELEVHNGED